MWYSAVSLLDMCAYRFNGDRFIEALPLTSMASLRWVQSANSALAKMPLVEFMECASAVAQWLYSTGHIAEPPAEITIQQFRTEEGQKSSALKEFAFGHLHMSGSQCCSLDFKC